MLLWNAIAGIIIAINQLFNMAHMVNITLFFYGLILLWFDNANYVMEKLNKKVLNTLL